jgi:hypothetical protein
MTNPTQAKEEAVQAAEQPQSNSVHLAAGDGPAVQVQGPSAFSPEQIRHYMAYEKVRKSGAYNMFDPRARRKSGLDKSEYRFVMKNFSALREQCEQEMS